jgi:hypothetical protein
MLCHSDDEPPASLSWGYGNKDSSRFKRPTVLLSRNTVGALREISPNYRDLHDPLSSGTQQRFG